MFYEETAFQGTVPIMIYKQLSNLREVCYVSPKNIQKIPLLLRQLNIHEVENNKHKNSHHTIRWLINIIMEEIDE